MKHDPDNLRLDTGRNLVWVGYASGALAALDPKTLEKKSDIPLKDHPEGFQLASDGTLAFVNVPDSREIAVVDRESGKQTASWQTADARANFPMVLAKGSSRVVAIFRSPSRLVALDVASGAVQANVPTCGDSDDVFEDAKRKRLYVSCGAGAIDVFDYAGEIPKPITRIATSSGARTSFFDHEGDRLYLAVRGSPAEIWVFEPN